VARDGVATRQPVRIGARTAADAEIVDGVPAGTLVLTGSGIDPGQRVRARAR
jgi:hypothetical protein